MKFTQQKVGAYEAQTLHRPLFQWPVQQTLVQQTVGACKAQPMLQSRAPCRWPVQRSEYSQGHPLGGRHSNLKSALFFMQDFFWGSFWNQFACKAQDMGLSQYGIASAV